MIPPDITIVQAKPNKTFNRMCPDIIFAKSRTDKLTTRITLEISSIPISQKYNANGAPAGKNRDNAWNPCSRNKIQVTPMYTVNERHKVTIK